MAGCRYLAAGRYGQANSLLRQSRRMQLLKLRLTSVEDAQFVERLDNLVRVAEALQTSVEITRNVAALDRINRIRSGARVR